MARKIAQEGTELYRKGKHEDIYSEDIEQTIQNIMNRIFGIFLKDIQHINLNNNANS